MNLIDLYLQARAKLRTPESTPQFPPANAPVASLTPANEPPSRRAA